MSARDEREMLVTVSKMICANGEAEEWTLRIGGETVKTIWTNQSITKEVAWQHLMRS